MTELSGLDLKEALRTALGWKLLNYETGEYAKTDDDVSDAYTNDGWTLEGWDDKREAWEWDPLSPAVSEPMFLEWCEKNEYEWQMSTCQLHDRFTEQHLVLWVHRGDDVEAEVEGESPSECRARAIVAASEKESHGRE